MGIDGDFGGDFPEPEMYTTTMHFKKGQKFSQFIADRPVNVTFDPVANMIFLRVSKHETPFSGDFDLEIVKLPIDAIDLSQNYNEILADLAEQGLNAIHEYFAVLLWHHDENILAPGESALVIGDVLEQAMMGKHIFSISHTEAGGYCKYVSVTEDNRVNLHHPTQWIIAAKQK